MRTLSLLLLESSLSTEHFMVAYAVLPSSGTHKICLSKGASSLEAHAYLLQVAALELPVRASELQGAALPRHPQSSGLDPLVLPVQAGIP